MSDTNGPRPRGVPVLSVRLIITVIVVLFLVGLGMTSFFVVDQSETGVILRLGRFNREVGPGLHWKMPLGIDTSLVVPTQVVQKMEFGYRTESAGVTTIYSNTSFDEESTMLTGDLNIANVEWEVQFRVTDARAWLFNFEDPYQTIRDISQSVMNRLVGDRAIIDVLGVDRVTIETLAQAEMNRYFTDLGLGVTVALVQTQNILPPAGPVQVAFEDVNAAIQDMNRSINEGREEINREIPRARGEAEQIVEVARGYAAERVNRARGDVARYLAVQTEYLRNPGVTRSRLYYEAMEEVFGNTDNLQLIDKDISNILPLLNLQSGVR
ncbi:MAG: FtsH protease activity modulator HflK [Spirochaetales bacterium]|nr:FtsH protease activity modulator HflK [Spirochaetales bacterium]